MGSQLIGTREMKTEGNDMEIERENVTLGDAIMKQWRWRGKTLLKCKPTTNLKMI